MGQSVADRVIEKLQRRVKTVDEGGSFRPEIGLRSTRIAYELMLDHFTKVFKCIEEGEHLVWVQGYAPDFIPIFYAMDGVIPFHLEAYTYLVGTTDLGISLLDLADEGGFTRDTCSSLRAQIGSVLSGQLRKPDFIVTTGQVCDGYKICSFISDHLNVPLFTFDSPFRYNDGSKNYYISELKRLIEFTEKVTGKKINYNKLNKGIENWKKVDLLYREINNLRKTIPSPMSARDGMRLTGYYGHYRTLDEMVSFMVNLRDELLERVKIKKGVIPKEEYRILWCQTSPFYVDLFKYLEEEFNAVVAFDELSQVWRKEDSMSLDAFEYMALSLTDPWNGPAENRLKALLKHAQDYQVDACIHFNQWGCRVSANTAVMVKETLKRELGIPTLILDGDYIDSTNYSDVQVKARIGAFIETLKV